MIPIYICDDNPAILGVLRRQLENAVLAAGHDMEIAGAFTSPLDLVTALADGGRRGIYFLDVELQSEHYDGFTLAAEIRRTDPRGFLVFVTTHGELAMETFRYKLEAMDYIVKDDPERLPSRLAACLGEIEARLLAETREVRQVYTVHATDEVYHVPVAEILYIETSPKKHNLLLHADRVLVEYIGSLSEAEAALGDGFWRIHRSYLVNRDRVRRVSAKDALVELAGGAICPLSRGAKRLM